MRAGEKVDKCSVIFWFLQDSLIDSRAQYKDNTQEAGTDESMMSSGLVIVCIAYDIQKEKGASQINVGSDQIKKQQDD